ncbi:hypothetical protein SBADM41S_06587 [Streptomyces badius]
MLLGSLAPTAWAALAGFAVTGLGLANIFPVAVGRAGELAGPSGVAAASTLGYGGMLLGPPAIGFLADWFSLPVALTTVALLAAAAAVLGYTARNATTSAPVDRPPGPVGPPIPVAPIAALAQSPPCRSPSTSRRCPRRGGCSRRPPNRPAPGARSGPVPAGRYADPLRHTGMVHRWAAAFITEGHTAYHPDGGEPDLDGACPGLVPRGAPPSGPVPGGGARGPGVLDLPAGPSPLAFWSRRQLNETTVHRVDAESALGGPLTPVSVDRAVDGIDELLVGFHARPKSRVRSDKPRTLRVRAVDTAATWTVRISDDPPQTVRTAGEENAEDVDCELSGTAEGLYLALWNRLPLSAVTLRGDRAVARLWTDNSAVTW